MFLLGKQQEVTQRLTDAMDRASERLAFEQAAIFRDQIQSLRQVQENNTYLLAKVRTSILLLPSRKQGSFALIWQWSVVDATLVIGRCFRQRRR
jgi:excinuclease ABC subunit C